MSGRNPNTLNGKLLVGRNEWCGLKKLGIPIIKAKIDTGAKTSALHAFNIKPITKNNKRYVSFSINPIQGDSGVIINCISPVIDKRYVLSSNGHKELRFVIQSYISLGEQRWKIELTLSNRDPLKYRMLLGREALGDKVLVDPSICCNQGLIATEKVLLLYT